MTTWRQRYRVEITLRLIAAAAMALLFCGSTSPPRCLDPGQSWGGWRLEIEWAGRGWKRSWAKTCDCPTVDWPSAMARIPLCSPLPPPPHVIFADGLETGDTRRWTNTTSTNPQ